MCTIKDMLMVVVLVMIASVTKAQKLGKSIVLIVYLKSFHKNCKNIFS